VATQGQLAPEREARQPRQPPHLFWPIVLITVGTVWLLSNLGLLPDPSWGMLWRLWPLVLIALGVEVLVGRRSALGAVLSALVLLVLLAGALGLVFYARHIPALSALVQEQGWQRQHVEHPVAGAERARIAIEWTSVPGRLSALSDSHNLIEADVDVVGELAFEVRADGEQTSVVLGGRPAGVWSWPWPGPAGEAEWNVRLSPVVPLELVLDASSGPCTLDLRDLQVRALTLDASSGAIELFLPSSGSFRGEIDGSSGALAIRVPPEVGVRVDLEAGSGAFVPGERFRLVEGRLHGNGTWETAGFETAAHQIELVIDQSSGAITIG
jgi:hypothetical protein